MTFHCPMESSAYNAGWDAFQNDPEQSVNTFTPGTQDFNDWEDGFHDARMAEWNRDNAPWFDTW